MTTPASDDCSACLASVGRLCHRHERGVLPQLAVNVGWLRLMGEALVEQQARQSIPPVLTAAERYAIARVARREARKRAKRGTNGHFRLSQAIANPSKP